MSEALILNRSGLPYDEAEAYHLASVLSRETGRRYRAIPWQSGYGVEGLRGCRSFAGSGDNGI